uniref:KIB1-4 beta-propeller domain-containing protein n=1 Tax=Kalanchoe fedtschenkoi TaxID=63787 RepID=A0A7N0T1G6_KALFE
MSLWESLSDDIGHLIIEKLPEVVEHIRFGAVCKRWYSIAREYHKLEKGNKRRPLPMLLTPPNTITGTKLNLYALSCRGNHYRNLTLPLPYAYRYCGSRNGWLATPNPDCSVTLEYPFGGKVSYIHLLVLDVRLHHCFYPEFTIHKLILSPDSNQDDYTVVVIYDGQIKIATIKSREESWFLIKPAHEDRNLGTSYSDIIFHKGLVYAVNSRHGIVAFDVSIPPPRVIRLLSNLERPISFDSYNFYLVESSNMDLLLVERHREEEQNRDRPIKLTLRFKVYKLRTDGLSRKITGKIEVGSLNDDALFIGDNMSFSFPVASFPGCEPDHIYFSDDFYYGDYFEPDGADDIGSFNMVKKSIEKHYKLKSTHKHMPPATWIFPPFPIYD